MAISHKYQKNAVQLYVRIDFKCLYLYHHSHVEIPLRKDTFLDCLYFFFFFFFFSVEDDDSVVEDTVEDSA